MKDIHKKLKSREKVFCRYIVHIACQFRDKLIYGYNAIHKKLNQKVSVILVSHDRAAKKDLSFSLRYPLFILFIFSIITFSTVILSAKVYKSSDNIDSLESAYDQTAAEYDSLRDNIQIFLASTETINSKISSFNSFLQPFSFSSNKQDSGKNSAGFFPAFFQPGSAAQISALENLRNNLEISSKNLDSLREILTAHNEVMGDIPSVWPIKGNLGRVTQSFGTNPNPFTGQPYFHSGLDISNARSGDPVIASGNGTVVAAYYDQSYGYNVVLKHNYGYYSRYAHMKSFNVSPGQEVRQGEVIGLVGNTGLSTGPHVHLEVWSGNKLMDPYELITGDKKNS